jgi:SAM-dependent methyltransferase
MTDRARDDARVNRSVWDGLSAAYREPNRASWASSEPRWGLWGVPERELAVLGDVAGKDVLELGCGGAYQSAWLARRGARPVGLDNSRGQLTNARDFQREFGIGFPLVLADGVAVPLRSARFDVVFNEYGAALWVDPERWLPEAARLLRPGGLLAFLTNGAILQVCFPLDAETVGTTLARDYFEMGRDVVTRRRGRAPPGARRLVQLLRVRFRRPEHSEVRAPADVPNRFGFVSRVGDTGRRKIWRRRGCVCAASRPT